MHDDPLKKKEEKTNPDASYDFLEEIIKKRPGRTGRRRLPLAAALAAAFFIAAVLHARYRSSDGNGSLQNPQTAADVMRRSIVDVETERLHFVTEAEAEDETLCGLIVSEKGSKLFIICDGSGRDLIGQVRVSFSEEEAETAEAVVVGTDPGTGLVALVVERDSAPAWAVPAEISEEECIPGDSVVAIGGPLGYSDSVAEGRIVECSETAFVVDGAYPLIGTDIEALGDGSGFLIGADGRALGCVFMGIEEDERLRAVPFPKIKDTIRDLIRGRAIRYAGILGIDVDEAASRENGVPAGVYVTAALPDSPALMAGLAAGDVITGIGGKEIRSMEELHEMLFAAEVGDLLTLRVLRDGADGYVEFQFSMTVGESDEIYQRAS